MRTITRFINYYNEGYMPWAHSNPDFNLVEMVKNWPVKPCKTLEIGCGTDAIWLAEQGFDVTAVDAVDLPIKLANETAAKKGVKCSFLVKDFLEEEIPGCPFQFIFDRGYFHSYKSNRSRKKLARTIYKNLAKDGLWITLVGSCDSPPRETGPPMQSAKNIVDAVEEFFEIKLLKSSVFGSESKVPANIWVGLFKKRNL
jgi:SAM-dependent methyltransferase